MHRRDSGVNVTCLTDGFVTCRFLLNLRNENADSICIQCIWSLASSFCYLLRRVLFSFLCLSSLLAAHRMVLGCRHQSVATRNWNDYCNWRHHRFQPNIPIRSSVSWFSLNFNESTGVWAVMVSVSYGASRIPGSAVWSTEALLLGFKEKQGFLTAGSARFISGDRYFLDLCSCFTLAPPLCQVHINET